MINRRLAVAVGLLISVTGINEVAVKKLECIYLFIYSPIPKRVYPT